MCTFIVMMIYADLLECSRSTAFNSYLVHFRSDRRFVSCVWFLFTSLRLFRRRFSLHSACFCTLDQFHRLWRNTWKPECCLITDWVTSSTAKNPEASCCKCWPRPPGAPGELKQTNPSLVWSATFILNPFTCLQITDHYNNQLFT